MRTIKYIALIVPLFFSACAAVAPVDPSTIELSVLFTSTPTASTSSTPAPNLPVTGGTPIPYPEQIITSANLDRLTLLAEWPVDVTSSSAQGVLASGFAISPDGTKLAAIVPGHGVKLFALSTGENIWSINFSPMTNEIRFSQDGESLIIACSLWSASDGTLIHAFVPDNRCWDLMFLPGGDTAALRSIITWSGRMYLSFWERETSGWPDVTSAKPLQKYPLLSDDNTPIGPANLQLSPDGTLLIATGISYPLSEPHYVWIFQVSDGKLLKKMTYLRQDNLDVIDVTTALSPDGQFMAIGNTRANTSGEYFSDHQSSLEIWQLSDMTKVEEQDLEGAAGFRGLEFSPDGRLLASAGRIWDTSTWKLIPTQFSIPDDYAFSPDQKLIVANNYDEIHNQYMIQVYGMTSP
jgi:WD40 repeat protein